ncbi:MAG: hypothetical protein IJT62_01160 [Oscillospiraceae bacterium]|nr:hypothetical protein [Oscillospiraceae bacterium]
MKIEMGESLFYSWLRHVKECQIVQTNWTTSSQWQLNHEDRLEEIMSTTDRFFTEQYGYSIYKKTSSLSQLLQQAECDAIGIEVQGGTNKIYAVDVAFHEAGLNYGTREATIKKIIAKSLRTAMCIYGYLDAREAEIIFASPKIHKSVLDGVAPCLADMQRIMDDLGFRFLFRIIANDDFRDKVLVPILKASNGVADTNELFIRSYQMMQMFEKKAVSPGKPVKPATSETQTPKEAEDTYSEMKIGKVAQLVMRPILESGRVSADEIVRLQSKEYSYDVLNLNFPLLVRTDAEYDKARYYSEPLHINGAEYVMCSQWIERPENNDRPYLMSWIREHQ